METNVVSEYSEVLQSYAHQLRESGFLINCSMFKLAKLVALKRYLRVAIRTVPINDPRHKSLYVSHLLYAKFENASKNVDDCVGMLEDLIGLVLEPPFILACLDDLIYADEAITIIEDLFNQFKVHHVDLYFDIKRGDVRNILYNITNPLHVDWLYAIKNAFQWQQKNGAILLRDECKKISKFLERELSIYNLYEYKPIITFFCNNHDVLVGEYLQPDDQYSIFLKTLYFDNVFDLHYIIMQSTIIEGIVPSVLGLLHAAHHFNSQKCFQYLFERHYKCRDKNDGLHAFHKYILFNKLS
jgi:hypothetical protein